MDFKSMARRELQALCKQHGIPAKSTNSEMTERLASLPQGIKLKSCLKSTGGSSAEDAGRGGTVLKKVNFKLDEAKLETERFSTKSVGNTIPGKRRGTMRSFIGASASENRKASDPGSSKTANEVPVRITRSRASATAALHSLPIYKKPRRRLEVVRQNDDLIPAGGLHKDDHERYKEKESHVKDPNVRVLRGRVVGVELSSVGQGNQKPRRKPRKDSAEKEEDGVVASAQDMSGEDELSEKKVLRKRTRNVNSVDIYCEKVIPEELLPRSSKRNFIEIEQVHPCKEPPTRQLRRIRLKLSTIDAKSKEAETAVAEAVADKEVEAISGKAGPLKRSTRSSTKLDILGNKVLCAGDGKSEDGYETVSRKKSVKQVSRVVKRNPPAVSGTACEIVLESLAAEVHVKSQKHSEFGGPPRRLTRNSLKNNVQGHGSETLLPISKRKDDRKGPVKNTRSSKHNGRKSQENPTSGCEAESVSRASKVQRVSPRVVQRVKAPRCSIVNTSKSHDGECETDIGIKKQQQQTDNRREILAASTSGSEAGAEAETLENSKQNRALARQLTRSMMVLLNTLPSEVVGNKRAGKNSRVVYSNDDDYVESSEAVSVEVGSIHKEAVLDAMQTTADRLDMGKHEKQGGTLQITNETIDARSIPSIMVSPECMVMLDSRGHDDVYELKEETTFVSCVRCDCIAFNKPSAIANAEFLGIGEVADGDGVNDHGASGFASLLVGLSGDIQDNAEVLTLGVGDCGACMFASHAIGSSNDFQVNTKDCKSGNLSQPTNLLEEDVVTSDAAQVTVVVSPSAIAELHVVQEVKETTTKVDGFHSCKLVLEQSNENCLPGIITSGKRVAEGAHRNGDNESIELEVKQSILRDSRAFDRLPDGQDLEHQAGTSSMDCSLVGYDIAGPISNVTVKVQSSTIHKLENMKTSTEPVEALSAERWSGVRMLGCLEAENHLATEGVEPCSNGLMEEHENEISYLVNSKLTKLQHSLTNYIEVEGAPEVPGTSDVNGALELEKNSTTSSIDQQLGDGRRIILSHPGKVDEGGFHRDIKTAPNFHAAPVDLREQNVGIPEGDNYSEVENEEFAGKEEKGVTLDKNDVETSQQLSACFQGIGDFSEKIYGVRFACSLSSKTPDRFVAAERRKNLQLSEDDELSSVSKIAACQEEKNSCRDKAMEIVCVREHSEREIDDIDSASKQGSKEVSSSECNVGKKEYPKKVERGYEEILDVAPVSDKKAHKAADKEDVSTVAIEERTCSSSTKITEMEVSICKEALTTDDTSHYSGIPIGIDLNDEDNNRAEYSAKTHSIYENVVERGVCMNQPNELSVSKMAEEIAPSMEDEDLDPSEAYVGRLTFKGAGRQNCMNVDENTTGPENELSASEVAKEIASTSKHEPGEISLKELSDDENHENSNKYEGLELSEAHVVRLDYAEADGKDCIHVEENAIDPKHELSVSEMAEEITPTYEHEEEISHTRVFDSEEHGSFSKHEGLELSGAHVGRLDFKDAEGKYCVAEYTTGPENELSACEKSEEPGSTSKHDHEEISVIKSSDDKKNEYCGKYEGPEPLAVHVTRLEFGKAEGEDSMNAEENTPSPKSQKQDNQGHGCETGCQDENPVNFSSTARGSQVGDEVDQLGKGNKQKDGGKFERRPSIVAEKEVFGADCDSEPSKPENLVATSFKLGETNILNQQSVLREPGRGKCEESQSLECAHLFASAHCNGEKSSIGEEAAQNGPGEQMANSIFAIEETKCDTVPSAVCSVNTSHANALLQEVHNSGSKHTFHGNFVTPCCESTDRSELDLLEEISRKLIDFNISSAKKFNKDRVHKTPMKVVDSLGHHTRIGELKENTPAVKVQHSNVQSVRKSAVKGTAIRPLGSVQSNNRA